MISTKLNKYQKNYDYLTKVLRESNNNTREKVENHLKGVMSKCLWFSLLVTIITLIACFLLPQYYPIWGIVCILILSWAWASALSARKIMLDFIDKELNPPKIKN
jgi:hypothetical protein